MNITTGNTGRLPQERKFFRKDITGLRAWAVITVVLFHYKIPGFGGGFIGVDIFFVISGYLMTKIIISGLEKNNFSLFRFYLSRARRIIPALLLLCLSLLILGWYFLIDYDFQKLAHHVYKSVTFLSNSRFAEEAGYFDTAAHGKWLLHTWSLSVEWQFYLLLPILITALWKFKSTNLVQYTLILCAGTSLCLAVNYTSAAPISAFFLLPARAWEMLLGGIAWLLTRHSTYSYRFSLSLELIGVSLIILALFLFDVDTPWPGVGAAVPVIGSTLILIAKREQSFLNSHHILEWFGTRSYSIYLWHWPFIVAIFLLGKMHDINWVTAALILSLAVSEFSYRYIEQPMRLQFCKINPLVQATAIAVAVCTIFTVGKIFKNNEFNRHFPPEINKVAKEGNIRDSKAKSCFTGQDSDISACLYGGQDFAAAIIGDSHAQSSINALHSSLPYRNSGILNLTTGGCPTIFGINSKSNDSCTDFNDWAAIQIDKLKNDIPLIIVNRASYYPLGNIRQSKNAHSTNRPRAYFGKRYRYANDTFLQEYRARYIDTICHFSKTRPVYIVRPIPEMHQDVPQGLAKDLLLNHYFDTPISDISISRSEYEARHSFIVDVQNEAESICGAEILDPSDFLCDEERCWGSLDHKALYYDDDHLNIFGSQLLVPMFQKIFIENNLTSIIQDHTESHVVN